jgi:hypothetical protein
VGFTPPEVGVLRLHLGATDYFRFDPTGGPAGSPAPITVSSCVASATGLVTLSLPAGSPSQSAVGFFGDSLGVKARGEGSGQPCGRIDGTSQTLILALTGPTVGTYEIDYAELDVEGKFNGTAKAVMYLDGTIVGTETLGTGTGSDSGPDSGDGDNYRWLLATDSGVPFDEVRLTVDAATPGGAVSLEGGADGTAPGPLGVSLANTTDSLFHLVDIDGVLDCGDTASETEAGDASAVLDRDENIGGAPCVPIPYVLRSGNDNVELLKDLGDQTAAQFSITITWQPEPAVNPLPASTIDYDGDGPSTAHTVEWCDGSAAAPVLPSGELWCLTNQSATLVGGGNVQVIETYYGAGDPVWLR